MVKKAIKNNNLLQYIIIGICLIIIVVLIYLIYKKLKSKENFRFQKLAPKNNNIIIIDDVRLFGKGPRFNNEVCNWEEISVEKIKNILNDRITEWYYKPSELYSKDRLIIHLKDIY